LIGVTHSAHVSIVLVNFNGHLDTVECIESLLKSSYQNYSIFVVDNSPSEESINFLESWVIGTNFEISTSFPNLVYPFSQKPLDHKIIAEQDIRVSTLGDERVFFIKALKNEGFAAANNIALKFILEGNKSEYVWLLNNDTVIEHDTLYNLVDFYSFQDEKTGIVGSKLLKYYDSNFLQAIGGKYNKWFGIVREIGANQKDEGQWDNKNVRFDYVIGASMFLRTSFIRDVGFMEQDLFLYYEEMDWAIRGKRKGWGQAFCSSSRVYHKMGSTINGVKAENSIIADFYSARNRIQIARKHFPVTLITLYPSFAVFIINRIKKKQWKRITLLLKILVNPSFQLK
jgi:GT2 family glycosyltransferase